MTEKEKGKKKKGQNRKKVLVMNNRVLYIIN